VITFGKHDVPADAALGTLVEVVFQLEKDAWHGHGTETMWTKKITADRYLLLNIPFYANGISYLDTVSVNSVQGVLHFESVAERGGHSTYRIFIAENVGEGSFRKPWLPLERLGCTYEAATKRFLGIDVPPEADIYQAYELLERAEIAGLWSFEEGHCGHPLKDRPDAG
jgi:hypothetical protein